jgi:peptidoglycan/xylan/chitin deacetylase (PgdA/CDA1 family)
MTTPSPGLGEVVFTSSWDDGHPLDLRLAELLNRRGFTGTFYIPLRNQEGLPVLDPSGIRELATLAELGSHTHDHRYLTTLDMPAARKQIRDGKRALEQIVGEAVDGFCYPGGKYSTAHRLMVEEAGFRYARTVVNFSDGSSTDPYQIPTSLQLYPHSRAVYIRNWLRYGEWGERYRLARIAVSNSDLLTCLKAALREVQRRGGVFHVWGHSWELEKIGGWQLLDEFLRYAADIVPPERRVANHFCAKPSRIKPVPALS